MTNKKDFTGAFQDAIDNENPAMNILSKSDTSDTKSITSGRAFPSGSYQSERAHTRNCS